MRLSSFLSVDISKKWSQALTAVAIPVALFLIAAFVYMQYGFQGTLDRDDATYTYSGQRMLAGVPPYQSITLAKGPVTPLITFLGAYVASVIGEGSLIIVRYEFWLLGCLTVVSIYLLSHSVSRSRRMAVFAALIFLGFWGFGRHVVSGPRPKAPVVLFVVLCLWLVAEKRWFWAAFFGCVGFLTWQPILVYIPFIIMFAVIQADSPGEQWKNLRKTIAGALLPVLGVVGYFWYTDGLSEFIEYFFLFRFKYLGATAGMIRPESRLIGRLRKIVISILDGYDSMAFPILLGMLMLTGMTARRVAACLRRADSVGLWWRDAWSKIWRLIRRDPYVPLLATFFAPLAWSLMDYQGYPDFYVFLPYVSIGFARFLDAGVQSLGRRQEGKRWLEQCLVAGLCVLLIFTAYSTYYFSQETGLRQQLKWADSIAGKYLSQSEGKLWVIGLPEVLVLLETSTPSPYVFVGPGITNLIEMTWPGGFAGWIGEIEQFDPDVITWGQADAENRVSDMSDLAKTQLEEWLAPRYSKVREGGWLIYVRNDVLSAYLESSQQDIYGLETGVSSTNTLSETALKLGEWISRNSYVDSRRAADIALALLGASGTSEVDMLRSLDLVGNPEFDDGDWGGWNPVSVTDDVHFAVEYRTAYGWAGVIRSDGQDYQGGWCQTMTVEPGEKYLYLVRAQVEPGFGGKASIAYWDYRRLGQFSQSTGFTVSEPADWSAFWKQVRVPAGVRSLSICPALLTNAGVVRVDNVWFIPLGSIR